MCLLFKARHQYCGEIKNIEKQKGRTEGTYNIIGLAVGRHNDRHQKSTKLLRAIIPRASRLRTGEPSALNIYEMYNNIIIQW